MRNELDDFYQNNLKQYGSSAKGVGWKNSDAQRVRFEQLFKVINTDVVFSINDLGCGVGDFISFLDEHDKAYEYHGYDVMPEMIERARERFSNKANINLHLVNSAVEMEVSDFTVASGIFNIRFTKDDSTWLDYILQTLKTMNERSRAGFAFNVLTKYSDTDFMKEELYYADPGFLFDHCKRTFSKNIALLHDYNQYDFTIIVRKNL